MIFEYLTMIIVQIYSCVFSGLIELFTGDNKILLIILVVGSLALLVVKDGFDEEYSCDE